MCMYMLESVFILSVCYCSRYFAAVRDSCMSVQVCRVCHSICRHMHVYGCISSVSICIARIGPLGHGNHHRVQKNPLVTPHHGNPLRAPQSMCPCTLYLHLRHCHRFSVPPLDPIVLFFLKKSGFLPVLPRP
jgi:hypothetical protein